MCKFSVDTFSFLLGTHLAVEFPGHMGAQQTCQTDFQSSCTTLDSQQQIMRVSISLHGHNQLLSFDHSHLSACEVVSHCDFGLKSTNNFKHLSCPCWLLWSNIQIFFPTTNWDFFFLSCKNPLCVLDIVPSQIRNLQVFSPTPPVIFMLS